MNIEVEKDVNEETDLLTLYYAELREKTREYHPDNLDELRGDFRKVEFDSFGEFYTSPSNIWGYSEEVKENLKKPEWEIKSLKYLETKVSPHPTNIIQVMNEKGEETKFHAENIAQALKVISVEMDYDVIDIEMYCPKDGILAIFVKQVNDCPCDVSDCTLIVAPAVDQEER